MKNEFTLEQAQEEVGWGSEKREEEEPEAKETATLAEAQFPLLPDPFLMTSTLRKLPIPFCSCQGLHLLRLEK